MTVPESFMEPLLMDIEKTTINTYKEFPKLHDKEVESVYSKLAAYFKRKISNDDLEEPSHPIERCEVLIDEILNIIDAREEAEADDFILNDPDYTLGGHKISSLNFFYATAFKRLEKSARFWRKENGSRGYINYVAGFLG